SSGDAAFGHTAFPAGRGAAAGAEVGGAAAVDVPPAGAAAVASGPHCALRKSRQVCPPSVPADLAAWYLTLHSFMVSACTGCGKLINTVPASTTKPADAAIGRTNMGASQKF